MVQVSHAFLYLIILESFTLIEHLTAAHDGNSESPNKKPNIVFILIDDLGFNDVSYHGSNETKTPNIDALARSGTVLTRHYTHSLCSPSRGALMTAKYATQLGLGYVIRPARREGLGLEEKLMPEYLREVGYQTHAIGKWHLGMYKEAYLPTRRGFDSFLGCYTSGLEYYTHVQSSSGLYGLDLHWDVGERSEPMWNKHGQYLTDIYTDHFKQLIEERNQSKPFFVYFAHNAVHIPIEGKTSLASRFPGVFDSERLAYLTQVAAVDESVGVVMETLEKAGVLNNTIVVVTSDNGGSTEHDSRASNFPLRGGKRTLFEGGVRTPALIAGPGIHKEKLYKHYFHISDWLPTLLEAVGAQLSHLPDGLDGVTHWKNFRHANHEDDGHVPRKEVLIGIETSGTRALIHGNYKLHVISPITETGVPNWYWSRGPFGETDRGIETHQGDWDLPIVSCDLPESTLECFQKPLEETICLFDIKKDPCEINNLAEKLPDVVEHLKHRLNHYGKKMGESVLTDNEDLSCDPARHGNVWVPWVD